MIALNSRIKIYSKAVFNAIAGISVEVLMTAALIFAGFIVCAAWWWLFR